MKKQTLLWCGLGLMGALWLTACGDGGGGGGTSNTGGTNSNNGTNQIPTSLAGKTFNFTTTSSDNFSEPAGSTFSVTFNDDSHFTYNPSPQNTEGSGPFNGTYTYDPSTATATFFRSGTGDTTVVFNFTGPASGTVHMTHPDGGSLDGTFTVSG